MCLHTSCERGHNNRCCIRTGRSLAIVVYINSTQYVLTSVAVDTHICHTYPFHMVHFLNTHSLPHYMLVFSKSPHLLLEFD